MKTLALVNGDLVTGPRGHVTISGAAKVRQDIALMLGELAGTDRFHGLRWGSVVVEYIGEPTTPEVEDALVSEVDRALRQYAAIQASEIFADAQNGSRSRHSMADVVRSAVITHVSLRDDSIAIALTLTTQAGATINLNRTVNL